MPISRALHAVAALVLLAIATPLIASCGVNSIPTYEEQAKAA